MKKTERVKPIVLDDKVEEFIGWYRRIIKERYNDYFGRTTKHQRLETITMRELLLGCNHNAMEFYTPEEQKLAKDLADILVLEAGKRLSLRKRIADF